MRVGFWLVLFMMLTVQHGMGAVPCPCTAGWEQKATHEALPCPDKPNGMRGVRGPITLQFQDKVVARSDGPVGEITVCLGETNILVADDCSDSDVCAKPGPDASPCDWYDFQVSSTYEWNSDQLIGGPSVVQTNPFLTHGLDFEINAQSLGAFAVTFTASNGMYKFRVTRYRPYAGEVVPEEYSIYFGASSVKPLKDVLAPGGYRYVRKVSFDVNIFLNVSNHFTNSGEAKAPCPRPDEPAPS